MQLTRRELLAGIGLGTLGVGGVSLGHNRPPYSLYTYAADGDLDDRRVRVAWYERYNGAVQETHDGSATLDFDATLDPDGPPAYLEEATFVTDTTGPVLSVGNVLPGDAGTLVIGLEVVDSDDFIAEPLDIWVQTRLRADSEGSLTDPEIDAGDVTPDDGELDEELFVELWRDGAPLGSCNGHKDFTESLEAPIVARSPMSDAFGAASDVGDTDGQRVLRSVSPGQSRCIALAWDFPVSTATNRSQGDSVAFDLVFVGVPAGATSPFTREVAE
ncbi:hypothetical protein [Salinibaculum salinum]|uniref:hypothetical protein n=1 Tax=Salinibaculum salinum TaxID=3131996 RepID=UPI0030EF52DD